MNPAARLGERARPLPRRSFRWSFLRERWLTRSCCGVYILAMPRIAKSPRSRMHGLAPEILADIVQPVVAAARPEKIILFGSAARGRMGSNSDVDLLVIRSGKFRRGQVTDSIYRSLRGVAAAVDVVVVTPEEVAQYHDDPYLVIAPALREGKPVYGA
jgi:predicted nucleotidyltransferase